MEQALVAKSSTLYRFQLDLSDIDRGLYESLDLRIPCHPSEDGGRLVVRVLARCLAHEDGLEFGRGLSNVEDPALWTRSSLGEVKTWIDIGCPSAERLHRASKRAEQVQVFTDKAAIVLGKEWSSREIYRAEDIEIVRLDSDLIANLAEELQRNVQWYVTIMEGTISIADGDSSLDGVVVRSSLAAFLASI